jgi:hypothetical protein
MTFAAAAVSLGICLLLGGGGLMLASAQTGPKIQRLWRSKTFGAFTFGSGCGVFLYHITRLGPSDFGEYKTALFLVFAGVSVGAFIYTDELLSIRGLSIGFLLMARKWLDAAYFNPSGKRLFLVSFVYFGILCSLGFGTFPYGLRDFSNWIFGKRVRAKTLGFAALVYGSLLIWTSGA